MYKSTFIVILLSLLSIFEGASAAGNKNHNKETNGANNSKGTSDAAGANAQAVTSNVVKANAPAATDNANTAVQTGTTEATAAPSLDPALIQTASESNGNPSDGQAPSLTDNENFINFCKGKTLTDGQQLTGGSCNGIVMGDIPSTTNMISSIILNPQVGKTIPQNTPFDIQVQTQNLIAGVFVNPDTAYYAAPQQLEGGKVVGHCHVVVQKLQTFTDTTPPSPSTFTFFKGINDDGNGKGLLKATVAEGLPAGIYRVCTIMGAENHQPPLMPVAQRGTVDDCTKFEVVVAGGNANPPPVASSTGAAAASAATNSANAAANSANPNNNSGASKGVQQSKNGGVQAATSAAAAPNAATSPEIHRGDAKAKDGNARNGQENQPAAALTNAAATAEATPSHGKHRGGQRFRRSYDVKRQPAQRFQDRVFIV